MYVRICVHVCVCVCVCVYFNWTPAVAFHHYSTILYILYYSVCMCVRVKEKETAPVIMV